MPTYVYTCQRCEAIKEIMHAMSSTPKIICDACGEECVKDFLRNALANPGGIIFKNPQGTSKMDSFDYKAHVNMEKAKDLRKQAARASRVGANPYRD